MAVFKQTTRQIEILEEKIDILQKGLTDAVITIARLEERINNGRSNHKSA